MKRESFEKYKKAESLGEENRVDSLDLWNKTESTYTVKWAIKIEELLEKLWKGRVSKENGQLLFQSESCLNGVEISWNNMLESIQELWEDQREAVEESKENSLEYKTSEGKTLGGFNYKSLEDMGDIMDDDINDLEDELSDNLNNIEDIPYGNL